MKVKTQSCLITLGPMTTVSKNVWPWEAEVLKEKFGGQCEFTKEGETDLDELPEVGAEFARLQDAHGVDEATKVSHVENAFGRGKAGLKELEKSINGSISKKTAPKSKPKKDKEPKKKAPAESKPAPKVEKVDPNDPLV
jgi:hypothetical protein